MKMKKLLLIPAIGMVAAFAMSNFIAAESYNTNEEKTIIRYKKPIVVKDDENPNGITLLSLDDTKILIFELENSKKENKSKELVKVIK